MNKLQFDDSRAPMRQIRDALGMTQMRFAQELGVQQTTVARWERGQHKPAQDLLPLIRNLCVVIRPLGLDLDDLPDDMFP